MILFFHSTLKKPHQAGRAYKMRETIMEDVIGLTSPVEAFLDVLAALSGKFAECTGMTCSEHACPIYG